MKKFYVHHNYSNDLVWYFFHGTELKSKDILIIFLKINIIKKSYIQNIKKLLLK